MTPHPKLNRNLHPCFLAMTEWGERCVCGAGFTQCHVHPCEGDWCRLVLPLCSWRQRSLLWAKSPPTPLNLGAFSPPLTAAQGRHRQQIIWAGLAPRKTSLIQKMATLLWTEGGTFYDQDSNTMRVLVWDCTGVLFKAGYCTTGGSSWF